MADSMRILIMAAGTGGHVFPGLAVAEALRAGGHEVVWLGSEQGLENRLVPAADLPLERIRITGLRGKRLLSLLLAPLRLTRALWQSLLVMRRVQPDVVLGMGGFVCGPGGLAAWLTGCPLCIHEQNAIAGLTNQLLSRIATRVMEAFPDALPADTHAELVGNPVRQSLHELPPPAERFAGRDEALRLLIIGGSQGARKLNQMVPPALAQLFQHIQLEVHHQTGDRYCDLVRRSYTTLGLNVRVEAFIDDMAAAYAWADLVICRAGAMTVTELTAVGLGSVLVPYPHAVDDHQNANAQWLVEHDAAVLIGEEDLTATALAEQLQTLSADRQRLLTMAGNAHALARPTAAADVAAICLEVAA